MTLRVFITGASSGIGEVRVREYAQRGAVVGLVAQHEARLRSLAASLPTQSYCRALDVREAGSLPEAAAVSCQRFGGADLAIGNGGVSAGAFTDRTEVRPVSQEILDINLVGGFKTFQPVPPVLRAQRRGTLLGIASAFDGNPAADGGGGCGAACPAGAGLRHAVRTRAEKARRES